MDDLTDGMPEKPEDEWSPEKEREGNPDKYMAKFAKYMDRIMGSLEGFGNAMPSAPRMQPVVTPHACSGPLIVIRPISNGFVMEHETSVPNAPSPAMTKRVETFFKGTQDGVPIFVDALDKLIAMKEAIHKMLAESAARGEGHGHIDPQL